MTSYRNREYIQSAIFLNGTVKYNGEEVINRLWLHEVKFKLMVNHLRLYPLELKNCRTDHNIVSIKNPSRSDLEILV